MFVLHDRKKGFIEIPGTGSNWVKEQCRRLKDYEKVDSREGWEDYEWHMVVCEPAQRFYWLWHHRYQTYIGTKHRGDTIRLAPGLECVEAVFADWDLFRTWFLKQGVPKCGEWQEHQNWNEPTKIRLWAIDDRWQLAKHLRGTNPSEDEPTRLPALPDSYTSEQQEEIARMYGTDKLLTVAKRIQEPLKN